MQKMPRAKIKSKCLAVLTGAALGAVVAGCVSEPSPFDPRAMQEWELAQDAPATAQRMYPLPTTQQSQYIPGTKQVQPAAPGEDRNVLSGPPVKMSLQEIVHRAIANSMDIRVAGYDTAVDQTRVMEAEANFDPSFFANFNFERDNKESAGIITSFDPVFNSASKVALFNQANTSTFQTGISQKMPAGGEVKLQYQVQNTWTNPQQFPLNPFYENELALTMTQPLLQNFGLAVNQARITIARNNQRVSLLDWRKSVEDTVLQIEKTYWQLVQANSDVATLKRLVGASEDTTKLLFQRQGADVTAVQIQQSNASTETRRVQLIAAETRVADLSDEIKRLMYDPAYPLGGAALIVPADDQLEVPVHFNLDDAIETGLENRLELGQQQVRISSAEIAMKVAKNNLLPQLNFVGSVTSDGVARRLDEAFDNQGDFSHIGYAAGLQFQFPLGNRAARAIWQRALLQRAQAIDSYRQLMVQVKQDVIQAARQVNTTWRQWKAARNARFAAEKLISALQQQQDAGTALTQDFVDYKLRSQEQLAQAEEAEHQSMNDYNFAIASLEKAKGTLLRYNNVILEERQLPFATASKSSPLYLPHSPHVPAVAPSLVGAPAK